MERIRFDGVVVDRAAGAVRVDGRDVACPAGALRLLLRLMDAHGAVVTRDEMQRALCPDEPAATEEVLTQAMFRLRATLGRHGARIVTVRGVGFRLDAAVVPAQAEASPSEASIPVIETVSTAPSESSKPMQQPSTRRASAATAALIAMLTVVALAIYLVTGR